MELMRKVLVLMVFAILFVQALGQPTDAAPLEISSPSDWSPSVTNLVGSSSAGSWSLNSTAKYYELPLNITTNGTWIGEFTIPNTYMGLDAWKWNGTDWVLMNGQTGYSLSVPYLYDYRDKINGSQYTTSIPADWGSGSFVVGTPSAGSLYRVQLRVDESAQLKVRIYYASESAVGFDGVNDYVRFGAVPFGINDAEISLTIKQIRINPNEYYQIIGGITMSPYRGTETLQNKITGRIYYNWRDFGEPFDNTNYGSTGEVSPLLGVKKTIAARFIRSNDTYQFLVNGVVVNQGSKSTFSESNLTTSWWELMSPNSAITIFYSHTVKIGSSYHLVVNASSFSSSTTVTDLSGAGNHGTAYGNVQYKVYQNTGFSVSVLRSAQSDFSASGKARAIGTFDLGSSYVILESDKVSVIESEVPGVMMLYGANWYTFELIFNEKEMIHENITSNLAYISVPDGTYRWVIAVDKNAKTITVFATSLLEQLDVWRSLNPSEAIDWYRNMWGIGAYAVLLLVPASMYIRTKNEGVTALLLIGMAAAGISFDQSIAPLATLTVVAAFGLLAYKALYKSD